MGARFWFTLKTQMSKKQNTENLLLLMPSKKQAGAYQWWRVTSKKNAKDAPTTGTLQEVASFLQPDTVIALVIPIADVTMLNTTVSSAERKYMAQTLPWMFEEQLSVPVTQLHFAYESSRKSDIQVVAIDKTVLNQYLEELQDAGLNATYALSAIHLLPRRTSGVWHCLYEDNLLCISPDSKAHYVCDKTTASTMFKMLKQDAPPKKIYVWGAEVKNKSVASKLLTSFKPTPEYMDASLLCQFRGTPTDWPVNILQGEFGRAVSWKHVWKELQMTVYATVLLALVYTASSYADYRLLRDDNKRLNQIFIAINKDVYPDKQFASPTQLREAIEVELGGYIGKSETLETSQFSKWIDHIGGSMRSQDQNALLRSINYNHKKGTMRIDFSAENFQSVENIRDTLKARGITSEVRSSANKGTSILTRLECKFTEESAP